MKHVFQRDALEKTRWVERRGRDITAKGIACTIFSLVPTFLPDAIELDVEPGRIDAVLVFGPKRAFAADMATGFIKSIESDVLDALPAWFFCAVDVRVEAA